jgi:osmotically-inducible protein OsmY
MRPVNWIQAGLVAAAAMVAMSVSAAPATQTYGAIKPAAVAKADPARPSDKALNDRIEKRLKADAMLKKFDIDVAVNGAVVTLTGAVRNKAERVVDRLTIK